MISILQYQEMMARTKRNSARSTNPLHEAPLAARETGSGGLHDQIIRHCRAQFPPWLYIHARTDQRSTIALGAPDFTIFLPGGRTVLIECKAKDGKHSTDQLGWALQARMLGHTVHTVRSMAEFLEVVKL